MLPATTVASYAKPKAHIISALSEKASNAIALDQQRYFKNVLRFRGLKAPTIDAIFKTLLQSELLKDMQIEAQLELGLDLLQSEFAEDKRIGVNFLKRHAKLIANADFLKRIESLFDKHVYDWGTCDSICGQVLHEFVVKEKALAKPIAQWRLDNNIWKKRASCVAFIKLARHGEHNTLLFETAKDCVKCPERFVQLGCGWVRGKLEEAKEKKQRREKRAEEEEQQKEKRRKTRGTSAERDPNTRSKRRRGQVKLEGERKRARRVHNRRSAEGYRVAFSLLMSAYLQQLLRELSLADLNGVVTFIKHNYRHFSREGLRYAIEKMDAELRGELLSYVPPATRPNSASSSTLLGRARSGGEDGAEEDIGVVDGPVVKRKRGRGRKGVKETEEVDLFEEEVFDCGDQDDAEEEQEVLVFTPKKSSKRSK